MYITDKNEGNYFNSVVYVYPEIATSEIEHSNDHRKIK